MIHAQSSKLKDQRSKSGQDYLIMRVFGQDYPVMRELGRGWSLIAHPNGPALGIAYGPDAGYLATLDHPHEEVPESIRIAAIGAYREISWPRLVADYLGENQGLKLKLKDQNTCCLHPSVLSCIEAIESAVTEATRVEHKRLWSRQRTEFIARARQICWWLILDLCEVSAAALGRRYGRNHGTILYGVRVVEGLRQAYPGRTLPELCGLGKLGPGLTLDGLRERCQEDVVGRVSPCSPGHGQPRAARRGLTRPMT